MRLPVSLIAAVATQVLCQLFKVFYYSRRDRRFSFRYFFTSGGMPSSHSAFVTALAVAIAVHGGLTSDVFAACAVFGFIVMHDAYRLRGTVEKQSKIIKQLVAEREIRIGGSAPAGEDTAQARVPSTQIPGPQNSAALETELPEMLGHTVQEIAVGIVVGAVLGGGITLLLERL
jgi:uncharacterized protein